MAEYQLSLDGFVRLFFAMAIIICGYGYVIIGVFIRDTLACILMLFGLTGLSALFSFMVFKDKNMWADSPDLTRVFYSHSNLLYVLCLDLLL
ncbi:hypothetical protein KAM622c_58870 (plasmid) [Klebsiella quasipneumoniae subsp. quasipneumoniae]|nr:hypothetical protein KAM622c_58870 [Klebsiella quasipneumoniae subsp. quasipneumoniae]